MGISVVNEKEIANSLADRLPPILAQFVADLRAIVDDREITIEIPKITIRIPKQGGQ